ncbi:MAG: hypothetical protein ACT4O5_11855 [Gammaproteobacteria bacterium]
MTLLARLVDTSQRVSAISARLVKVRELAACPRAREPGEIDIGVQYLSGEARQERFGIGHAVLQAVSAGSAARNATLTLADVDRRLTEMAGMRGAGMTARRSAALRELFSKGHRTTERDTDGITRVLSYQVATAHRRWVESCTQGIRTGAAADPHRAR